MAPGKGTHENTQSSNINYPMNNIIMFSTCVWAVHWNPSITDTGTTFFAVIQRISF